MHTEQLNFDLFVPDRFEPLRDRAPDDLSTIVEPVNDALNKVDELFQDLMTAGRGAFLILRGDSGTGKSTFLHTIHLFRDGYETYSVPSEADVRTALNDCTATKGNLRIIVLEGREALTDISREQIERDLHSINSFLRTPKALRTLVVWTCNTPGLEAELISVAQTIGGDSLLGIDEEAYKYCGPSHDQFRKIAQNTVATLNQGANLADMGVSDEELEALVTKSISVGRLLGSLRRSINKKQKHLLTLLKKEQCKLWIIVAAGNEPNGDVAALTRGSYSAVDIERLLTATEANIVKELKSYPEKLGILATVLDAKIFHLPMLASLDIVRTFASEDLRIRMRRLKLSDKATRTTKPKERLAKTDLGRVFAAGAQGTLTTGSKPGSNTQEAFQKLVLIAQQNDAALNKAVGDGLIDAGYIESFESEKDLAGGLSKRMTDLCCSANGGIVRLEFMWRTKVGRADIANYTLTKLHNYGRAIGFLENRTAL